MMVKKRRQKNSYENSELILILVFILGISIIIFNLPTAEAWTKSGNTYNCSNCSDCTSAIADASSGDIVQLNVSLSNINGTCIEFGGKDNITFDCQNHYIQGNGTGNYYGIYLNSNSNNNTIKNCNISEFNRNIYLEYSYNNSLENISTSKGITRGIFLDQSDKNTIKNITSNNETYGLDLYSSDESIISDIICYNNSGSCVYMSDSKNNNITNIRANYSAKGIQLASNSNNNTIVDSIFSNGQQGIDMADSTNNTLTNITINNNSQYGIYLHGSPEYNLIYNNLFNNTVNYYNTTNLTNYFNTTKTLGTNIMGGPYIGGNYWAYPNGTGFSENCTDANNDGLCDSSYSLDGVNYDYLALDEGGVVCTESWTCTAWSACSGGTQTRTCTDANSCGTTVNKPAESQSCTVGGGNGGGITKDQPVETAVWTEVTPEVPLEMDVTNPEIDLTQITVEVSETVQDVSIEVIQIDVVPLSDIKIGMVGGTYQSFKIETTGINDTNVESVTIEFKVNKTWIIEQEGAAGDVKLYKQEKIGSNWDELQTTLTDSDTDYYYFSSTFPSFSIFAVLMDLSRCNNNNICEIELGENEINCPNDCKIGENRFFEMIKKPFVWIVIIFVSLIVIVSVIFIIHLKRNKRSSQMMEKEEY